MTRPKVPCDDCGLLYAARGMKFLGNEFLCYRCIKKWKKRDKPGKKAKNSKTYKTRSKSNQEVNNEYNIRM